MEALSLLFLLMAAAKNQPRIVKGRSGRTYAVTAGRSSATFVTSNVSASAGGPSLIVYPQYTAPAPASSPGGVSFKVGDRELIFRAPVAAGSAAGAAAAAAVKDFGPFAADN